MATLEFTPTVGVLLGIGRINLSWKSALAEVIDNALDAGAKRIDIDGRPANLTVRDDGRGCAKLSDMVTLGAHREYPTTQSGVHGIGGTQVMCWLRGRTHIITLHQDVLNEVSLDWAEIMRGQAFSVDTYEQRVVSPFEWKELGLLAPHGTKIQYIPEQSRSIGTITTPTVRNDLSWLFRPALEQGCKISISYNGQKHVLAPRQFPRLLQAIELKGCSINDKEFDLIAGVIDEGESVSLSGFHLARGLRVIETTNEPANGYNAPRFFAWVRLNKDHWVPDLNKNALIDYDRQALFARLTAECEPLLRAAEQWSAQVQNDTIEKEIELELAGVLEANFGDAFKVKEKRQSPHTPSGTNEPRGTDITRRRAQRVQGGDRVLSTPNRAKPPGFSFRFDMLDDEEVFRVAVQDRSLRVTFNDRLPLIQQLKTQKHQDAIKAMAHAAIATYAATHQGQQILLRELSDQDTIGALQRVWQAWSKQRSLEVEAVA